MSGLIGKQEEVSRLLRSQIKQFEAENARQANELASQKAKIAELESQVDKLVTEGKKAGDERD